MRKSFIYVFLCFVLILDSKSADFYSHCLLPGGANKLNIVKLPTVNKNCRKICERECQAFSRKFDPYFLIDKNSKIAGQYSIELNEDVILKCYKSCQKGPELEDDGKKIKIDKKIGGTDTFKSKYFEAFVASCKDENNEDIFFRLCVDENNNPASDCTESLKCNPGAKKGYISFYKILQEEVSIGMTCLGNDPFFTNRAVETNYIAKPGDEFSLSIAGGHSQNELALCGKAHLEVEPVFYSKYNDDLDQWYELKWKNKDSHRYLSSLSADQFNKIKTISGAKQHWNAMLNDEKIATSYAAWGARNASFFDTGLYIRNGDYFSIMWKGEYTYASKFKITQNANSEDYDPKYEKEGVIPDKRDLVIGCGWSDAVFNPSRVKCNNIWNNNSHLLIKKTDVNSYIGKQSTPPGRINLLGEEFRKGGIKYFGLNSASAQPSEVEKEYGLVGKVTDIGLKKFYYEGEVVLNGQSDSSDDKDNKDGKKKKNTISCSCSAFQENPILGCHNKYNNYHCINEYLFKAGETQYLLSGKLDIPEFSNRKELSLMHYDYYVNDVDKYKKYYSNNFGGYSLSINWSGCPKKNGENVQYTIAPKNTLPGDDAYWIDVPEDVFTQGKSLKISQFGFLGSCQYDCKLYLRIKLEQPEGESEALKDQYHMSNTYGQYYINVVKNTKGEGISCVANDKDFIYKTMKFIKNIMVGEEINGKLNYKSSKVRDIGAAGMIFENFLKVALPIIKIFIVLAVVIYSISYIIGMTKYSTEEFVKTVFKFAVVFALFSEYSWNFFGGMMVPFFIDGGVGLVAEYTANAAVYLGKNCRDAILSDPYQIFTLFDRTVGIFLESDTWSRIWAICTRGFLGIVTALLLVIAIGYYILAIFKSIVMFMFSIIMLSILLIIAPLFLVMTLLPKAKDLFSQYVKTLFSYMLQPLFVYTAIIIMNFIVMMLLYYIFNFTACSKCLIRIDLGILYNECWLTGYQSIVDMHTPFYNGDHPDKYSLFSSYAMSFVGSLIVFLVASGMSQFASSMSSLASWIITGSAMRHSDIGGVADSAIAYGKAKAQQVAAKAASTAITAATAGSGSAAKASSKVARSGVISNRD